MIIAPHGKSFTDCHAVCAPKVLESCHVSDLSDLDLLFVVSNLTDIFMLVNDILDYSKLASGSFSISHDVINVADIIQSVFRAHRKFAKPEISLEIVLDPRLPKAADGDSLRYRQIVQNFLSNALKFTEEGYVRIRATLKEEDEESWRILTEVIDTGIGVADDVAGALFTPFTQFSNSATKKYKGTGLGLSICKSLAELMGGDIGFSPNTEGKGSRFWYVNAFTAFLYAGYQINFSTDIPGSLPHSKRSSS